MGLSDEDVREILRIIDSSPLDELRIESDGFSLHVRRGGGPVEASPARAQPPDRGGGEVIASPMLGTFYRAEGPGRPPFVEVGSRVEPQTTVGIVEVMKM